MSGAPAGRLPWLEVQALALASALLGQALLDRASYVVAAASFSIALGISALRRARATRFDDEGRRRAERHMGSLMIAAALLVPLGIARTPEALRLLGVVSPLARNRLEEVGGAVLVAATVALLLPILLGEMALRASPDTGPIDGRRFRMALRSGGAIAAVVIVGAAATFAAGELHVQFDTSRDDAARPSAGARLALARLRSPARVELVFRQEDETAAGVRAYFDHLSGSHLRVGDVEPSRRAEAESALGRQDAGFVLLTVGEATEHVLVAGERGASGAHLRRLDGDVRRALTRLGGLGRVAYLTSGHDEASATSTTPDRRIERLCVLLESQGLTLRDLDLGRGLGDDVPSDAAMVLVLGATGRFAKEEVGTLGRYRDRGGRVLLAIDPADSGNLELHALFGLDVRGAPIALTRPVARRRNDRSDAGIVVVTGDSARGGRFASHPSVATLARQAGRAQLYVPGARALAPDGRSRASIVFAVETSRDAFLDGDQDFERSEGEPVGPFVIGAAIEDRASDTSEPWRAFVLGSVATLTDEAMASSASNSALAIDVTTWLRGEEDLAALAPPEPERIVHNRKEDALWFWLAIVGMPALLGALGIFVRRRLRHG